MKNLFGVMQGRLLPKYLNKYQAHPIGYWQDEFKIASDLNFDCIEFIFDFEKHNLNPLFFDSGLDSILENSKKNKILVKSICADYFMESPIFIENLSVQNENFRVLKKIIINSQKIGIKDIVIPLVDKSSILGSLKKQFSVSSFLKKICVDLRGCDVNICLETDLPPQQFINFVKDINEPQIKINYDIGNSVSMGYSYREELDAYSNLITNIHIKDRLFNGSSVTLGDGDTDFKGFFSYLSKKTFKGIFIMQAFRDNDPVTSLIPQNEFIISCMNKYFYNNI